MHTKCKCSFLVWNQTSINQYAIHSQLCHIEEFAITIVIICYVTIGFITPSACDTPMYIDSSYLSERTFVAELIIDIPIDTTCPNECVSAMKHLELQKSHNTICCWMYSNGKSHRIYIDTNMTKQVGCGSCVTVYDAHIHYQVEYNEWLITIIVTLQQHAPNWIFFRCLSTTLAKLLILDLVLEESCNCGWLFIHSFCTYAYIMNFCFYFCFVHSRRLNSHWNVQHMLKHVMYYKWNTIQCLKSDVESNRL